MSVKIFTIIGAPGAGKGSVIKEILKLFSKSDCYAISCSKTLKDNGIDIDTGVLVTDDIVNDLLTKEIEKQSKKYPLLLLDGYPRTVNQFNHYMSVDDCKLSGIIEILLPDEVIFQRIQDRLICPNCHSTFTSSNFHPPIVEGLCDICNSPLTTRNDDELPKVQKRLEEFYKFTHPIISDAEKVSIPVITYDNTKHISNVIPSLSHFF